MVCYLIELAQALRQLDNYNDAGDVLQSLHALTPVREVMEVRNLQTALSQRQPFFSLSPLPLPHLNIFCLVSTCKLSHAQFCYAHSFQAIPDRHLQLRSSLLEFMSPVDGHAKYRNHLRRLASIQQAYVPAISTRSTEQQLGYETIRESVREIRSCSECV